MTRATPVLLSVALAALAAGPGTSASTALARAPSQPLRIVVIPSGVAAIGWVPISKNLGFAIERRLPKQGKGQLAIAQGYFAVKRSGHWLRLDPIPRGALFRGPTTSRSAGPPWVPITRSLGFVIQRSLSERGYGQIPSVLGYFVVKRGDHRLRLDPIPHGALFRGPVTSSGSGPPRVSITKSLGFVIEQPMPGRGNGQIRSVLGYFVIKRGGHRLRLDPIPKERTSLI